MNRRIAGIIIFAYLLLGCSNQLIKPMPTNTPITTAEFVKPDLLTETPRAQMATETHVSTFSTEFRQTIPVTQTRTPTLLPTRKPTLLSTYTATIQPKQQIELQYQEVRINQLEQGVYTGTIVLVGNEETPSYLLNLATTEIKPLVTGEDAKASLFEAVSPDRIWLAYEKFIEDGLVVRSIDGKESINIPWEQDWYSLSGWLNNKNLLVALKGGSYIALNPFSGERRELFDKFPGLAEPIGVAADWWGIAVYSPNLTHAVYPKIGSQIVLWDLQTNQPITSLISAQSPFGGIPVWSPSGNEFILALSIYDPNMAPLSEELYKISLDGQKTRVTNFKSKYPKVNISGYAWSPNSGKVAFWLTHETDNNENPVKQLVVLDMETLQATEYCIYESAYMPSQPPIWSPDGTMLVVESTEYNKNQRLVVLLDLVNGSAVQVVEDLTPVGWMINP